MSAGRKAPVVLPLAWYWTIPALSRLYDCHPDQLYYALDAGQLRASVIVAKHQLPPEAHKGAAPNVVIVLKEYRSLAWQHVDREATAHIAGPHMAFVVNGDGFAPLPLDLIQPVSISRRDLVILDESKEEMEAACVGPRRTNRAEQKATTLVIRSLLHNAYADDIAHPYKLAKRLCASIELMGGRLSKETIAKKLKEALAIRPMA